MSPRLEPKKKKKKFKSPKEFRQEQIENRNPYEIKTMKILEEMQIKFEYQKVYGPYLLDFYLPDYRVDLEMDGYHHKKRKAKDRKRSKWLRQRRIWTLRFWNSVLADSEAFKRSLRSRLMDFAGFEDDPPSIDPLTAEFKAVVG